MFVKPKERLKNVPSTPILMSGHWIMFRWRIIYLGVTVNAQLSWMLHVDYVQKKAVNILQKLNRLTRPTGEADRGSARCLVAERIILYAAPMWYIGYVKNGDQNPEHAEEFSAFRNEMLQDDIHRCIPRHVGITSS